MRVMPGIFTGCRAGARKVKMSPDSGVVYYPIVKVSGDGEVGRRLFVIGFLNNKAVSVPSSLGHLIGFSKDEVESILAKKGMQILDKGC